METAISLTHELLHGYIGSKRDLNAQDSDVLASSIFLNVRRAAEILRTAKAQGFESTS